jgi:DivIVA domain-containing protein
MDLTPSQISGATFRTVRKGYDPAEVDSLLRDAASALEQAQQQATAMEARARAAVARLHEQSAGDAAPEPEPAASEPATGDEVRFGPDEAETISRTLLLAQRTADTTIATAEADAERILADARSEADATLDSTREMSARLVEDARNEARKASDSERLAAANEVESLKARREFLLGDVDQLESFLIDQRERLRGAARQLEALCDRVPSGLGSVTPPAMSASDDEPGDDTAELFMPPETRLPFAGADQLANALDGIELRSTTFGTGTDAGELDATQPIGATDGPALPIRGTGETDAAESVGDDAASV